MRLCCWRSARADLGCARRALPARLLRLIAGAQLIDAGRWVAKSVSVAYDLSLLVIDGGFGFGNGA